MSNVLIDQKNQLEELKTKTDAHEVLTIQVKIVHEIKTRMMMFKAEHDSEVSKMTREIGALRQAFYWFHKIVSIFRVDL